MKAAAKPMMGMEHTTWRIRTAIRKSRKKTSSRAFESSSSLVLILNFIVVVGIVVVVFSRRCVDWLRWLKHCSILACNLYVCTN